MNPDDDKDWAKIYRKKYFTEEKAATDWKNDPDRYEVADEFDKLFQAYGPTKEDWDRANADPNNRGYPQGNPYHKSIKEEALEQYIQQYKKILYGKEKATAENVTKAGEDNWNNTPAVDDRWNELKEMMRDFNGTPMEKLAAIEKFMETH